MSVWKKIVAQRPDKGETKQAGSPHTQMGVWAQVGYQARPPAGDASVWVTPAGAPEDAPAPERSVWRDLAIRDVENFKPLRIPEFELQELQTSKGEAYWILKNLRQNTYLRLNEQQVYWWDLLDGKHNIQDMAVANFLKYQSLTVDGLVAFLSQLQAKGFLEGIGINIYEHVDFQLKKRTWSYRIKRFFEFFISSEFSIRGVDRFYDRFYRFGGRIFFWPPVVLLIVLVSVVGVPLFFRITKHADLSLILGTSQSLPLGIITLIVAQIFSIFTHESAHALATKHYGRTLRRGGAGLYFGMLVFFMDTTDIWMEPRRPRLVVTWAGPLSGFFLGGLATLILRFGPFTPWTGILYQFAAFCIGISILNLNPLLKLDAAADELGERVSRAGMGAVAIGDIKGEMVGRIMTGPISKLIKWY